MKEQKEPPGSDGKSNSIEFAAEPESAEEITTGSEQESQEAPTESEPLHTEDFASVPPDLSFGFQATASPHFKNYSDTEAETDEEEPGSSSGTRRKKAKRMRCPVCQKKLTVVNQYECRCGITFCSTHRYPESHTCTFDYKEEGKRILTLENPLIVAPKLTKI